MIENFNWLAVYTKPRWEKKVSERLRSVGLAVYCPLRVTRSKWSDRYKNVLHPLFTSYLFVKIKESEMSLVRNTAGVVNFVYWLGKPAIIREEEIERIKSFLNEYPSAEVRHVDGILPGDKVEIKRGVFMEQSGTVLSTQRKTVAIKIESLSCLLVATVDKNNIEVI